MPPSMFGCKFLLRAQSVFSTVGPLSVKVNLEVGIPEWGFSPSNEEVISTTLRQERPVSVKQIHDKGTH